MGKKMKRKTEKICYLAAYEIYSNDNLKQS